VSPSVAFRCASSSSIWPCRRCPGRQHSSQAMNCGWQHSARAMQMRWRWRRRTRAASRREPRRQATRSRLAATRCASRGQPVTRSGSAMALPSSSADSGSERILEDHLHPPPQRRSGRRRLVISRPLEQQCAGADRVERSRLRASVLLPDRSRRQSQRLPVRSPGRPPSAQHRLLPAGGAAAPAVRRPPTGRASRTSAVTHRGGSRRLPAAPSRRLHRRGRPA